MSWQPQEGPLVQLGMCLKDTLGADNEARKRATEMIRQAEQSPDISNYLCYLFVHPNPPLNLQVTPAEYRAVRSAAALLLKNHLRKSWQTMSEDTKKFIKTTILLGLSASEEQIRSLTGNVITEIIQVSGLLTWPGILEKLIALVEGADPTVQDSAGVRESAMGALAKVCEDNRKSLDRDYNGQRPLDFMIPKLLSFTASPIAKVRSNALASINFFIPNKSQAVMSNLDNMLKAIFALATDTSEDVRRNVCRAIVSIVDVQVEAIKPHMDGIVDYMISQQKKTADGEESEVAAEAAEFWLTLGEHDVQNVLLEPYLGKIVPTLLESMVYSEEDMDRLGGEGDDMDEEDKKEDIKPVFAKSKTRMPNGADTSDTNGSSKEEGELSDEEAELEEEFGTEDPEDKWNLRKCSAAALDVIASAFGQTVFDIILPYLKQNLFHAEWQYREAAVLALGAVASGCMDGVTPHLPELVPYLIGLLDDPEPLVRQITCWTLGRYSAWAAELDDPQLLTEYFEPMMEGLLKKMLDKNKRVQAAGASAFANLEEQSKDRLIPYTLPIVQQFIMAMGVYKDRNMYILYDSIQTLAEHVGNELAKKEVVDLLMPALIGRWKLVKDENRELFPLLECLSFVAQAMGPAFQPFAVPIFNRCVQIIHSNLQQAATAASDPNREMPDTDFLVTSLDLLSTLIQALDEMSIALVASARPHFFELLCLCLSDPHNDVRQSAYALLGDCAIFVFPQLHPWLPQIMGLLIAQLDLSTVGDVDEDTISSGLSVINNACWSCGEIGLKQGAGMAPYVEKLFERLLAIIQANNIPKSMTENAAISLGRLGLGSCDELAPHLASFAEPFLRALAKVAETDEKDSAFKGFILIVGRNPEAMESCLALFFRSIARYKNVGPVLGEHFRNALIGYKSIIPDWNAFIGTLSQADQDRLRTTYGV